MSPSGLGRLEARGATMASLAGTLGRILGKPVVDRTALPGRYDLDLEYSPEDSRGTRYLPADESPAAGPDPAASIFASIQQLGLKLEPRKVPMDSVVVDHAEKIPAEN